MISIAIMGVNNSGVAEPGLPLVRLLRGCCFLPLRACGITDYPLTPSLGLPALLEKIYYVRPGPKKREALYECITRANREGFADYVVPGLDADVSNVASLKTDLSNLGIRTLVPSPDSCRRISKLVQFDELRAAGIDFARTKIITDVTNLHSPSFPLVVKGSLCDSYLAKNIEELCVYLDRIDAIWGMPALIQEYLEGDEYSICCLAGPDPGVAVDSVSIKKIGITDKGKTWMGVVVENTQLRSIANLLVRHLGWVGPMEIELLYVRGRGYVVFEVNPRLPAWVGWLDSPCYGVGHLYLDLLLGRDPQPLTIDSGRVGVRINKYVSFPMTQVLDLATSGSVRNA